LSGRDEVGTLDFSEVFFTVFMHWTLASGHLRVRLVSTEDRTLVEHCSASSHADMAVRSEVREDRTVACVRSRCTRRVWSTFSCDGPLLETTGRHVVQRLVISICVSGVACTRAL
jgi:hypothetical protein